MAMIPHPVTGLLINTVETRSGSITDKERDTARLLLAEGHPRWVVAAMLGRFPLAFDGTGRKPSSTRRKTGGNLTLQAAANDPRQMSLDAHDAEFDRMYNITGP